MAKFKRYKNYQNNLPKVVQNRHKQMWIIIDFVLIEIIFYDLMCTSICSAYIFMENLFRIDELFLLI